jgi:hypothetical protein
MFGQLACATAMVPTAKASARATARYRMVRPPFSAIALQSGTQRAGWQMVSQRTVRTVSRPPSSAAAKPSPANLGLSPVARRPEPRSHPPSRSRRRELQDRGCRPLIYENAGCGRSRLGRSGCSGRPSERWERARAARMQPAVPASAASTRRPGRAWLVAPILMVGAERYAAVVTWTSAEVLPGARLSGSALPGASSSSTLPEPSCARDPPIRAVGPPTRVGDRRCFT